MPYNTLRSIWGMLRYGSVLPARTLLAICAFLRGVFYIWTPNKIESWGSYGVMAQIMPLNCWGYIYLLFAFLLTWRLWEKQPRPGWSRLINACTFALWSIYPCTNFFVFGYLSPHCSSEIGLMLAAAWATMRTDLTNGDRVSA
jgi:hypothetical protein